ncbi:hypothetical protein G7051_12335 [Dysgonomonas sp. HDW5B]|uniref:beta strand repeat-containing protein n=1 Tax=Dysgonomonas sp. HDW5B TaxID=2714927 RepID=UPI00140E4E95|nr:hypothetical protein [Dysgonomonas sp. HDW5B]QIK55085.1 hypothetical protein G7051_12335 [Dysgonomonas sp. HDW5B]
MKRKILSIGVLLLTGGITYAQVGVNTEDPKATFDVMPTNTGASTAEGFIAPRLTRTQIISKDTQYALPQTGTIVYVTDLSGSTTTKTAKITQIGYYYFDGTLWQPFTSSAVASSNPWYKVGTALPSTLNTDDSYLTAKTVIGGNTIASINGGTNNAQLTVVGEDAFINGITVGKGSGGASSSTAVGASALESVSSSGSLNTAVGSQAMQYAATTSGSNTAIGAAALRGTASNSFSGNTAVGNGAIQLVTSGSQNTAMGSVALFRNTSGNNNTAIGWNALLNNSAGNYNTALGSSALLRTTASDNIGIGLNAGSDLTTGGNNLIIGTNAQAPTATASNQMNIGNALFGITSTSNSTPGRVSIGKTAPASGVYLDVAGLTQITGANTLRYVDGNQAAGKVLVSDASGNASWGTLPAATVTTANNGLTMNGTTTQLGGALTQATSITGASLLTLATPTTVSGALQISSGTPGAGRVLTSDASGNASWGTLPAATVTTANNGLTINGTTTQLGGALTQATNITGASRLTLATPTTVSGALQIISGTPGAGRVLTSDASGNATWVAPTVTTANNGLTMNGTTTQLGGALTQATSITGASRLTLATPTTVSGALQISSGTPGAGRVLTSDASGNASWGTLPAATVTTANNGLTMNGTTTQLGGALTQATNITGASRLTLATPTTVSGALQISSGTPGAGKILTSDASGNASWNQPNVFQSPMFPSASGTSYNGSLASNINSGISVTLPANSTWIIHVEQLIRFNRSLKTYQSGGNILSEGIWVRMNWSDTPTGTASADIRGGQLISAACNPGINYHMLIGDTVLRNTSAASKTYYLTTSKIDTSSLDPSSPITFDGLFFPWSENTLYAIPTNN